MVFVSLLRRLLVVLRSLYNVMSEERSTPLIPCPVVLDISSSNGGGMFAFCAAFNYGGTDFHIVEIVREGESAEEIDIAVVIFIPVAIVAWEQSM